MPDLYNERTGVIERNIPSDEVDKKVSGGGYSFPGDTESGVYVGTTSGKAMRVAPSLAADYIRAGSARYLKPSTAQGMMDNDEFAGSLMGQLSAIPYGIEDYLGAGVFSSLGEAMGVAPGQKEAVQAQNPWTWHTSGIVPSAVAAFLSGGTTAAGQLGAKGLTQAAKQAAIQAAKDAALKKAGRSFAEKGVDAGKTFLRDYTLPGIGAKLGRSVQDKTYDGLMQHGSRFVPATIGNAKLAKAFGPHAAKVISGGIAASVENGVWGAGEGISEAMLGEPAEAAEHIWNSIGTNMAIGLGVGGAVSAAIPMLTGAAGIGAKSLSKIIDFQSFVGGKTLKNSEAFIRAVGKRNNMPPEQINRMVEALTGDNGEEMMRQMSDLRRNLDKVAGTTRELVDSVLLTDDFVQLSDLGGFSRETLIDLIRATKSGHSIDFSVSRFEAEPFAKRLIFEISELEKKTKGQTVLPGVLDELSAKKGELREMRAAYLDENQLTNFDKTKPSLPESPLTALQNAKKGIDVAVLGMQRLLKTFNETEPTGIFQDLIHSFKARETEWYRGIVNEETEEFLIGQHRLNNPKPKPLSSSEIGKFDRWESYWDEFNDNFLIGTERAEFKALAPILKKMGIDPDHIKKSLKAKSDLDDIGIEDWQDLNFPDEYQVGDLPSGPPIKSTLVQLANDAADLAGRPVDFGGILREIKHASAIAADTGDASQLVAIYKRYKVKLPKPRGITQDFYDGLKRRSAPWGGEAKEANLRKRFKEIREHLNLRRTRLDDPVTSSVEGEPQYGSDFREEIHSFLSIFGDSAELPDAIVADSFKVLEDIQTSILKNIQYGLIPSGGKIESDLTENVINVLKTMMTDETKWGLMATQKSRFNKMSVEFQALRGQVLTDLTEKSGTSQVASPGKILSFFNQLDSQTSAVAKENLSGYVKEGSNLLEFITTHFEPVDFANLIKEHPGAVSALEQRLSSIDIQMAGPKGRGRTPRQGDLPIDDPSDTTGINRAWRARMDELQQFMSRADMDLNKTFKYIEEELPLAKALTSEGARQQNLNNAMSDMGRGGAASAFTFLATGSPVASAVVGLGIGSLSMAMDPVRLMSFVNQLRIAKGASQDVIGEYLEDWLTKKLPAAAIHKNWEKNARQMFMIGSQASRRDIKESKSDVRKKMAKGRIANDWSERIQASLDSTLTDENFFEAASAFSELVSSASVMNRFLEDSTKVFENTPDLRQAMSNSLRTRITYAHRIMPKVTNVFLQKPIPPTRTQLDKWGTALKVLNSPTDVMLTALITGSITEDMVTTLREGWPKLYEEISQKAMELVSKPGTLGSITREQSTSLSILLGISSVNSDELAQLNKAWSREDEKKQGSGGSGMRDMAQRSAGDATSLVERPRL